MSLVANSLGGNVDSEYIKRMLGYVPTSFDEDSCWLWKGSVDGKGYGRFWVGTGHVAAHRVVYEYFEGEIPKGLNLLHSCDTPLCVNPKHMTPGTQKENLEDAVAKGRIATGQRHGSSKLTDQEGRQIHDLANSGLFSNKQVGKWYGIAGSTVSQIKTGARRSATIPVGVVSSEKSWGECG